MTSEKFLLSSKITTLRCTITQITLADGTVLQRTAHGYLSKEGDLWKISDDKIAAENLSAHARSE